MRVTSSRSVWLAVALVVQLALVPLAVAGQLSARLTGQEYLLEVAPVDPIDPFRGAYVALSYPGLPDAGTLESRRTHDDVAYVPLVPDGEVWVGSPPRTERPASGPYLRCHDSGFELRCGIESLFLPQAEARAMEEAVQDGRTVARVKVDGRGNAALLDVEIRGDASP